MIRNVPIYQNDALLANEPSIAPYGCLATTIRQICEARAGHALDHDTVLEWYRWCVSEGHILDVDGNRAWVQDHGSVGRAAQFYLGVPQTFRYLFRQDNRMSQNNFGRRDDCNAWIAQVRCRGWEISHFVEADESSGRRWDPYWPPREIIEVLSIRGYSL